MNERFRNAIIRDLMRTLKADYWKLYAIENDKLLKMYEMLVPKEQQNCSLKGVI